MEELKKNINENDAMQLPLVSICSITYNHAPYIRQCLDGFLMQKTNFKYEIIIHDDASTDGTAEIIKEYAEKYPDLITPIFQTENQFSKGLRGFYARFVYPRAKGKYIALCDGDDYWTDPLKLQKQVDFLEDNPDYVMSSHRFKTLNQENKTFYDDWYGNLNSNVEYDFEKFITFKEWYTQPLSVLFLRSSLNLEQYYKYKYSRDLTLFYNILKKGRGIMFNEFMGVYRLHYSGIWTGVTLSERRTSDLQTTLNFYEVEGTKDSAKMLYNRISQCHFLGVRYIVENYKLLYRILIVIFCQFGFLKGLNLTLRLLNIFSRH